jgi:hypothetical protein
VYSQVVLPGKSPGDSGANVRPEKPETLETMVAAGHTATLGVQLCPVPFAAVSCWGVGDGEGGAVAVAPA